MDLTTTTRVKTQLDGGGGSTGTKQDTLIGQLISVYSASIEKHLGRWVQETARTEQFDIQPGQQRVYLKGFPVTTFTSVKHADDRDFDAVDAIDSGNYYLDEARGCLTFDGYYLAPGPGVLQVVSTGGMGADTADFISNFPAVAQACDMQVAYVLTRARNLGTVNVSTSPGSVAYEGAVNLLPEVKRILDQYRRTWL